MNIWEKLYEGWKEPLFQNELKIALSVTVSEITAILKFWKVFKMAAKIKNFENLRKVIWRMERILVGQKWAHNRSICHRFWDNGNFNFFFNFQNGGKNSKFWKFNIHPMEGWKNPRRAKICSKLLYLSWLKRYSQKYILQC